MARRFLFGSVAAVAAFAFASWRTKTIVMSSETLTPSSAHWQAYWSAPEGRRAAVSGDAAGAIFDEVWRRFLRAAFASKTNPSFLDLACGAGVVLERAMEAIDGGQVEKILFVGLDFAPSAAAAIARKTAPDEAIVAGVAATADTIPFSDGVFDIVVSQFGLEYAGLGAFDEAARVLAPGAAFQFVVHYKDGAIYRECCENRRVLDAILESGFFETIIAAIRGPDHDGAIAKLNSIFDSLKRLLEGDRVAAKEMLGRLLSDAARLVARRQAYHPDEAVAWCEAMRNELALYEGRMRAMTQSALDRAGIEAARNRLLAQNPSIFRPEVNALTPQGSSIPAAWLLKTPDRA